MALPKRDWLDMTWQDIAGAATARWIAVLPLAAVEQHGPHRRNASAFRPSTLPIRERLASRLRPRSPRGLSLARASRAGLRKLVLVTSHGGNVAAMELVARDLRARHAMLAVTVGWHRFGYPDGAFSSEERKHGIHAGDIETSLMLAAMPNTVRMDKAARATPETIAMAQEFRWLGAYRPAGFAWMTQDLNPTGAVGDATLAKAEKGKAALAQGAQAFVELLREIDRFDLSRLRDGPLASK